MKIKPFLSVVLVAVTGLLGACSTLGTQGKSSSPAVNQLDRSLVSEELNDLNQRLSVIEINNRRRFLAERDAYQAGRNAASAQTPPKSLACVRLPKEITQSVYYTDFSFTMGSVYTTSCLYAVDEWDTEQKAKAKTPAPVLSKPPTKK